MIVLRLGVGTVNSLSGQSDARRRSGAGRAFLFMRGGGQREGEPHPAAVVGEPSATAARIEGAKDGGVIEADFAGNGVIAGAAVVEAEPDQRQAMDGEQALVGGNGPQPVAVVAVEFWGIRTHALAPPVVPGYKRTASVLEA